MSRERASAHVNKITTLVLLTERADAVRHAWAARYRAGVIAVFADDQIDGVRDAGTP